ncbi:MAG: heparinase II/III family protein, partial [Pyrinomonadaceae bacterium]
MSVIGRIRRALRGEISVGAVLREAGWRGRAAFGRGRERAMLDRLARQNGAGKDLVPRLSAEYARMSGPELLEHFRSRARPKFFAFEDASAARRERDAAETMRLLEGAEAILNAHRWPLLGYGELDFGAEIDWLRDPVSGAVWSPDYHAKVVLVRGDGSDVRVLWELNRLSHLSTLARAYAVTRDGRFAEECFAQIESWRTRNPVGRGPNWSCAMEVALRALNLLAAFQLVRRAPELNEARLRQLLSMFDEHGAHVRRNLEFSHIATSNHYLSDVVGLFWLGLCLPELRAAREWREFGLREMLREMDKQVLADGAHCEASTGYHRFVTELFLYSFILARDNHVEIDVRYLRKLRAMLD